MDNLLYCNGLPVSQKNFCCVLECSKSLTPKMWNLFMVIKHRVSLKVALYSGFP